MSRPLLAGMVWLPTAVVLTAFLARAEPSDWRQAALEVGDTTLSSSASAADLDPEISGVAAEQARTAIEFSAVHERLVRDGKAWLRLQRTGLTPLAGGMNALLSHASRTGRLQRMIRDDIGAKEALGSRLRELTERRRRLEEEREKRARNFDLLRATASREDQQAFSASFTGGGHRAPSTPQQPAVRVTPSYGLYVRGQSHLAPSASFSSQRGRLAMPVAAATGIVDARRSESDGPGLELRSEHGARIRAAAEGHVVFAGTTGTDGKTVVVDHGDQYFTVYGGFDEVEVEVGDEVSAGARLGTTGTGTAYFEVRRGTRTQDARAWLGI
jgi:murein DD-endopeptidase MepM/ murein hydrolase activator NlpD